MKKSLLAILSLLGAASCIDSDYDLANLESETSIGTETSEFHLPVARITISAGKLGSDTNDQGSILDLYREADIWLPATLPGNAEAVDVERISSDGEYRQSILDATFEEMGDSAEKRTAVSELIAGKYRTEFANNLALSAEIRREILEATVQEAAQMIAELYVIQNSATREAIALIGGTYLSDMRLEPMEYAIPKLDLSGDVRDMLAGGGYLYGTIESELPFRMRIWPKYRINTNSPMPLDVTTIDPGTTERIEEFQLTGQDFEDFLNGGMVFYLETEVEQYYPARGIDETRSVFITLKLRKTGSLKL